MMKWDKKEFVSFLIVIFLALIGIVLFWGKQGHISVDTGREFYIPEQMLSGQVLYKDIFNIYGALAYQINSLLFKIFGVGTLTLHVVGNIVGIGIVVLIYLVSRQVLDRFYSVLIAVFAVYIGIFRMGIFNYTLPYSFAVTYGLLCALIALYFICIYYKQKGKRFLYFSVFFAGGAFALKYDFAPFLLVYPILCYLQKESVKTFFKLVLIGLIIPFISFFTVFMSGLNFNDFFNSVELFRQIAQVPSLRFFYENLGVYVTFEKLVLQCRNLIYFILVMYLSLLCFRYSKKLNFIYSKVCSLFGYLFICLDIFLVYQSKFLFIGCLVLLLFMVNLRKIFLVKNDFIFLLALLLLSTKTIFVCDISTYGIYSAIFLLIALVLILAKYYSIDERYLKIFFVLICTFWVLNSVVENFKNRNLYSSKIETQKGWISAASDRVSSKLLVDIILSKTQKSDKIVILPEGHKINFLTDRKSDDFYGNLIPMYVEAFGEQRIIQHYSQNMPHYFILMDRKLDEYGKQFMCVDYAQNLCHWILENYHVVYKISGEPQYIMLRKNK